MPAPTVVVCGAGPVGLMLALEFRVVTRMCWEATAWLARRYRHGRVLLTGALDSG